jgi:uncharacterized membrane protein YkoI
MNARALAIVGAILVAASPVAAAAQPRNDSLGAGWAEQQNEARRGVQQRGNVSLAQVIATIKRVTPGSLLDAGLEAGADGREEYRVRWAAADGRRIDFHVDARTGAVLRAGGG